MCVGFRNLLEKIIASSKSGGNRFYGVSKITGYKSRNSTFVPLSKTHHRYFKSGDGYYIFKFQILGYYVFGCAAARQRLTDCFHIL